MSRSYKKTLIVKDKNSPIIKKLSNKRVRQSNDNLSNSRYKKATDSYDICDMRTVLNEHRQYKDYNKEEKARLYRK